MRDGAELPQTWASTPLGELGEWRGGGTPSKKRSEFWQDGSIPWVSPKDMKREVLRSSEDWITPAALAESAAKLISAGSVLIVTRSGILKHTLPVARTEAEVTINQDLKAITPFEGIDPGYLAHALRCFADEILRECSKSGTTVASVVTDRLSAYRIPLAPAGEQRRITDALDAHFSRLDAATTALQRVQANLKRYRASVLKAACEGRLLPTEAELARCEGREYEPADVLLDRILAKRRERWEATNLEKLKAKGKTPKNDRWREKYKEPQEPDTDELPELPDGWVWATVGQLSAVVRGASPRPKGDPRYFGGDIPWIMIGDVSAESGKYLTATREYVTEAGAKKSRLLPSGTLVLTNSGTVCVPKILKIDGCIHDGFVAFPTLSSEINQDYLYYWFEYIQPSIVARVKQGVTQVNLNTTIVRNMEVALPPVPEQARIVMGIEREVSTAEAASTIARTAQRRSGILRKALLKRAFEGRLVPQDPDDEPASVLLERIRAQREDGARQRHSKQTSLALES